MTSHSTGEFQSNATNSHHLILKKYKIVGCEVARQDDLPFKFVFGSCNSFAASEEKALLCFSHGDPAKCHLLVENND